MLKTFPANMSLTVCTLNPITTINFLNCHTTVGAFLSVLAAGHPLFECSVIQIFIARFPTMVVVETTRAYIGVAQGTTVGSGIGPLVDYTMTVWLMTKSEFFGSGLHVVVC